MIIIFHPWVAFSSSNTSINIDTVYCEINISFNTETMLYYYLTWLLTKDGHIVYKFS